MKCPKCNGPGRKVFGGYCSRVHRDLDKKVTTLVLECANCGRPVSRLSTQVSYGGKVYCKRCPKNSGASHPSWKEGQYLNPAGYRLILVKGAYKLEHRHTWEQANRACLLPEGLGIVSVHHINMIKTDNRPENLVMLTNVEHGRVHRLIDYGRFDEARSILLKACDQQVFFILDKAAIKYVKEFNLRGLQKNANK